MKRAIDDLVAAVAAEGTAVDSAIRILRGRHPPPPPPPTNPFTIKLSFDPSCSAAPSGFQTVIQKAAADLMSHFSDPITVNINIGFGEFAGMPLGASALASTDWNYQIVTYASLVAALKAKAKSEADITAVSYIPAADPIGGQWFVTNAQAKALGFLAGAATGVDAYIGFTSTPGKWDFNNTDGVLGYDLAGTAAHEITEALGRVLVMGQGYSGAYNLMCYSAVGALSFTGSTPRYFSVNGGQTPLNTFNTNTGGDFGDWQGDTVDACNAFGSPNVPMPVSESDLIALDVVGWNRV